MSFLPPEDSSPWFPVVTSVLKSTESIKAIIEAESIERTSASPASSVPNAQSFEKPRVLAIVSNSESDVEEGAIFVFKVRPSSVSVTRLSFASVMRITHALEFWMAQSNLPNSDGSMSPVKDTGIDSLGVILTIKAEEDTLSFGVRSTEPLSAFLAEIKRFKMQVDGQSIAPFVWLESYTSEHASLRTYPRLSPCMDIRLLRRPTHQRLSHAYAGHPGDEDYDIGVIRDDWIRTQLRSRESEYAKRRPCRIRVCTFNVNGRLPSQDLSPWIRPQRHEGKVEKGEGKGLEIASNLDQEADIFVTGFQELDLSTSALLYSTATTREDAWADAILASLGEAREEYTKLASKQLVGMLLIVFVKKSLVPEVSEIRTCAVGTGILGMMGNKGAVAVRLTIRDTKICFVNAHFAAFDEQVADRNQDFHDISRRLVFNMDSPDDPASTSVASENIFQSDMLFWSVNLNYRIDLPDPDVRAILTGRVNGLRPRDMLPYDQLSNALKDKEIFEHFAEAEIHHAPTYRYGIGMLADELGYDTKRRPAWTDRILSLSSPCFSIQQTAYDSHPTITMSDHRPLSAVFNVDICTVDHGAYNAAVEDIFTRMGEFEDSEELPRMQLSSTQVDLGEVRYERPVTRELELKNAGPITCVFRFIPQLEDPDGDIHPPWLSIEPVSGLILPNSKCTVKLTVHVTSAVAEPLNLREEGLEATLILHTERGKDHFVFLTGSYKPTCLGVNLSSLARLSTPVRSNDKPQLQAQAKAQAAPKEFMRLVTWMMSDPAEVHDIFLRRFDDPLVQHIVECLDTGAEFDFDEKIDDATKTRAMGEVLLRFLKSLPVPVFPVGLMERCTQVENKEDAFEILSEFPAPAKNVWITLTAFLHYLVQRSQGKSPDEKLGETYSEVLASIFAPILLPNVTKPPLVSPIAKWKFLRRFLQE